MKKIPKANILEILQVNYDGLEEIEKEINMSRSYFKLEKLFKQV